MKNALFVVLVFLNISLLKAQVLPQHVEFEELGLSFDIPNGWTGQIDGEYVILGHNSVPGIMVIFENNSPDANSLKSLAEQGIYTEAASLSADGNFTITASNRVEGMYKGFFNGSNVKSFAIGLINGLGKGMSIVILTETNKFSEAHKVEASKLANSVKFFQARESANTIAWKKKIVGMQLKYMYTNSSSDYTGGYSGVSSTITIDLCNNGTFAYYSNSNSSFSAGGISGEPGSLSGFGYTNATDDTEGNYSIGSVGNNAYLTLNFKSGKVVEYDLSVSDQNETYLDDTRYFVIDSERCY